MTSATLPSPAACPACVAFSPEEVAQPATGPTDVVLSLPGIHCAACISTVERVLSGQKGVKTARVNLSLKRVLISRDAGTQTADLISALEGAGYEAQELDADLLEENRADPLGRDLLMRLAVSGFAMMNVMLLSVAVWSGAEAATRDMMHWISALIALPTIAFSARPFFASAATALKSGRLNMDVPISLAILLAAGMSLYETSQSGKHAYFDAALSLTFFLLAGRYLDFRTRFAARSAAQELAALEVPRALVLRGGIEVLTAVRDIAVGDIIRVNPGMRIPLDGEILSGTSELDRAFLTGESLPAFVEPGTQVSAGEVNLTGNLEIRVTHGQSESALHRVARLVEIAETSRNKYTSLADRAAQLYAPGVHLLAAAALVVWWGLSGDFRLSLNIAIATLIITCPCALGLAVPAVTTAASGILFRKGVLLKSATALERLAEVDLVVFDKTGTLTLGAPVLENAGDLDDVEAWIALGLAKGSQHPLARSLAEALKDHTPTQIDELFEVPGYGIEGLVNGQRVRLGRAAWLGVEAETGTASWLAIGASAPKALHFTDQLRPGVETLIAGLAARNIETWLITGDGQRAAHQVAQALDIPHVLANTLPEDKLAKVQAFAAEGRRVLMVGDGLNDTGALAAAYVSASPASAIDAARVASDIVLLGRDISVIAEAIQTAKIARRRIKENFALAAAYNLIAVPIALLGFATPLMAALAMSTSSVTVTLNSWRVR